MQTVLRLLALTPLLLALGGCDSSSTSAAGKPSSGRPQVALVSNGVAEFWTIAKAGAHAGAKEFDVDCDVRMPGQGGVVDQQRIIEDLLSRGVDGIAISPIDPENQHQSINEACKRTILITQDSDAPKTDRLCYVGMNNYDAGRMVGKMVEQAIPDGGEIMLFIGRLGQLNADQRRQGVIDEVLDRSHDDTRRDPQNRVLKNEKYTILGTRLDGGLRPDKTKANAEDALTKYPNLACMVGLFEYNPPAILEALAGAGKLRKIKVIGFDENRATLQAIRTGEVYGTVVQNPFEYGRRSVRILAGLARGDRSVLPQGGFEEIRARPITKTNVDEFEAELDANLARARGE